MKTKHLVAMALPLVFTACSQEELVTENSQTTTANRKTVENVVFKFNAEAESRMAFDGGKYTWENGDKFGACLMDQFIANNAMTGDFTWEDWFKQFELEDYIQSNYPFTRQENGSWTNAEAVMQEGNYFFYFPYNSNMGGLRTPIRMNVPTDQYVADGEKTYKVLDNQMFLAYAPIVADPSKEGHETITNITMEPLLAFPAFNITNNTGTPFTISRIAIGGTDGKGDGNNNAIKFPSVFEVKPKAGNFDKKNFVTNNKWSDADRRQQILNIVSASSSTEETVSKVNVVFGEKGKTLANGENFTSYIMLPALNILDKNDDKTLDGLELYIYTDKGLVTVPLSSDKAGDDIKVQNYLTEYEYNDGHKTLITLDERAFETPGSIKVSSTRDLEDLVEWNKNTQGEVNALITRDVTITKKIYDLLTANSKLSLTLQGDGTNSVNVTIPADAPANAIDRVKFNGEKKINIVNEGNVTISKALTTFNSLTNNGTISIATSIDLSNPSSDSYKVFTNNGKLSFDKKDLTVSNSSQERFINNGDITVTANVSGFKVANWGTITINEGITANQIFVDNSSKRENNVVTYGTLYVNGKMSNSTLRNNATVFVGENGEMTLKGSDEYITNYSTKYEDGDKLLYRASIENSGVISGLRNTGYVIMKTKNARLTSASAVQGFVDNTICSPYVAKVSGETIYANVSGDKKASEVATIVAESNAALLQISGNITVDPAEEEKIVTIKGQQSSFNVTVVDNLNIKPANNGVTLRFVDSNTTEGYAAFSLSKGTTIIENGVTLSIGSVTGNAKIIVQANATVWSDSAADDVTNLEKYGNWTKR